jgi:Raf kinase inhibitor-like YbhB/YbcL family protein
LTVPNPGKEGTVTMPYLTLTSPAFEDEGEMPDRFSFDAGNVSPPLEWSGLPEGTVELALLCEDEDANHEPFLNWLVTRVRPDSTGVAEGAVPPGGLEWTNGSGKVGWAGPHPPAEDEPHRYIFRLYALPEPSVLPEEPRVDDVRHYMVDSALACAVLVGLYGAPAATIHSGSEPA